MARFAAACLALLLAERATAADEIRKWRDAAGVTHYSVTGPASDSPGQSGKAQLMRGRQASAAETFTVTASLKRREIENKLAAAGDDLTKTRDAIRDTEARNLVVYSPSGQALWSAYVPTSPGDRLCMQSDGNAVVYSPANSPLWATMTLITAVPGQTLTANPGAPGQCTWWAEHQFLDWTGTYINTLGINGTNGNALYWAYNAAHRGWATGSTPRIGSIAVFQPGVAGAGSVGHVAWVTEVYPSQNAIEISEMNFKGPGIVDNRRISPAFGVAGLQYIYANP